MVTQNDIELIKYLEDEFNINQLAESIIDNGGDANDIIDVMKEIAGEMAKILDITPLEAMRKYQEYQDMLEKALLMRYMLNKD